MDSQELCATMRWIESAQAALQRCEEAPHDPDAVALAAVLRAAIDAKTETLRAYMRQRVQRLDPLRAQASVLLALH
jgi:hypothetical protein